MGGKTMRKETRHIRKAAARRERRLLGAPSWLAGFLAVVLALTLAPSVAMAAPTDSDGETEIGIEKYIESPGEGTLSFSPGESFTYTLEVECSYLGATAGGCINMIARDEIPAPLELQSVTVSSGDRIRNDTSGNVAEIAFIQDFGGGQVGMTDGTSAQIFVLVKIPDDITWMQAQSLGNIVNTGVVTADGSRPLRADDPSTIVIDVPEALAADATKTADDNMGISGRPIPAVPGRPVDFEIGGANTSNRPVDTLTITDPAAGTTNLEYLDFTSVGPVTPPAGADQFTLVYTDASGTNQLGPFAAPTDAVDLSGIDTAAITSLSFVFSNSAGTQLPPSTGSADYASIGLGAVTNDTVLTLPENTPLVIHNVVSATVTVDGRTATDTASDDVTVTNVPPSVVVGKTFDRNRLLPGEGTTATLRADNGGKDVVSLTITDPVVGQPNLREQGLIFDGFAAGVEWPATADSVTVTYTFADGSTESVTRSDVDKIPASTDPANVVGFEVAFEGPIDAGAYAVLPFAVTSIPVDGDAAVTTTNTVDATVVDSDGATRNSEDAEDVTRLPLRVYTDVQKNIVKDDIFSRPGSTSTVTLTGQVNPDDHPTQPSTVGSDYLIVQDPADPQGGSDFFNHFDVAAIGPIDVPQNASMTAKYWDIDDRAWKTFDTSPMPVPAGSTWSYTVPASLRDTIGGVQFTFEPAVAGELLEPGFNVNTPFKAQLRDDLRDGSGPASGNDVTGEVGNEALSAVENPDTGQGQVTDIDQDVIALLPVDGEDGPDLVNKDWQTGPVGALSGAETTATLSWGTLGLPIDSMTITDPTDPQNLQLQQSVFDAFDLVRIGAITPANDPGIRFDAVYAQRLTAAGEWKSFGDGFTAANPSVGSYPEYTLSPTERADTIGIRFIYTERADRASVITNPSTDPAVGSGVAETPGLDRQIPLILGLRDFLRSVPIQPVLGSSHIYKYNSDTPGLVINTVHALGESADGDYESTDQAEMEIVDRPLNAVLDKRFVDYDENASDPYNDSDDVTDVGVPQVGTAAEDYPLVTALLRGTNTSNTRVATMTVNDPDPNVPETILDQFNLYRIADVSVPAGADPSLTYVKVTPAIDGLSTYTVAQAQALTPTQLAGVMSVEVFHSGRPGAAGGYDTMIAAGASTTIRLEYQLRPTFRTSGEPIDAAIGTPLYNHAILTQTRPGIDGAGAITPDVITDLAQDDLLLQTATYGVNTTKSITPGTRIETQPRTGYLVQLLGKPTGTVRTTELSLSDDTPTFWNAFRFTAFTALAIPRPVQQVRISVLTGVKYSFDTSSNTLSQTCDGASDLTDCWSEGAWLTPSNGTLIPAVQLNASLTALGIAPADVQGVRFEYRRADGSQWERPSNPTVRGSFAVERRENLVYGTDGAGDTEVPSTRPGLAPAPGETVAGHFTDVVVADAVGGWEFGETPWVATASDDAETVLTHVSNGISVSKVHGRENASTNRDTFAPGSEIPYRISIRNTGGWPITGLTVVDTVESDASGPMLVEPARDFDDPAPIYSATLNGTALPGFSGSMGAGGVITFVLPADFVFAPNAVLAISAQLVFRQNPDPVAPGTRVDNGITATSDRFFDTCDYTVQGGAPVRENAVESCSSSTEATPTAISPISTTKSVKGVGAGVEGAAPGQANYDDLGVLGLGVTDASQYCGSPNAGGGYYRSPCVPITRPGGTEEWRVQFTNNGNIPMTKVVSIDVLPALGDTGVILSGQRSSRWAPTFLGSMAANFATEGGSLTTYYSTTVPNRACNEAEIQYLTGGIASGFASCTTEVTTQRPTMWQVYSDSLSAEVKATIKALKFVGDFSATPLLPNEGVQLTFRTQTPWYADRAEQAASGVDPIAWNSFATGAVGRSTTANVQSPVVEPRKVGVALATGQIRLEKTVDGASERWGVDFPSDYLFTLSCTSGGVAVPLVNATGQSMSTVRLAADGTPLVYNGGTGTWGNVNLPLYADCTVTEDSSSQGAVVTYDPAGTGDTSGAIRALRFAFAGNVVNHAQTGAPGDATISALNTYLPGGFEVSKAVDNGGATDQDGTAISYDDRTFSFEATCTFLGGTVLDETFSVSPGSPREFADLPSGAECTVKETEAAGAVDTTVVLTEGGVAGDAESTTSTSFVVLPYDGDSAEVRTTVAFTNVYTAGTVEVTKSIAGADQWADGEFVLAMTCTLNGVSPNPVYTGSETLTSPDNLVWTVENLPTGASCEATETSNGGANATSDPLTLVVGDDSDGPVTGTITNTFTTGALEVVKALDGLPAAQLSPATEFDYTVELSCTREVNGESVPVAIPGGATRTITGAGSARYDGLPTGALCNVTETDPGHATSHTITPDDEIEISTGENVVEINIVNEFANGSISIEKAITAPEGFPVPSEFTATVSCTWYGAAVLLPDDGLVTLVEGVPITIDDIPVGSVCAVVEDDFGQVEAEISPSPVTVEAADQTFAIVIENVYEWAALRVGKVVEAPTSDVPTGFQFHATCTFRGETVLDETITLDAGDTHDFTDLPARSRCEVVETDTRGADDTLTEADVDGAEGPNAPQIDQVTRTVIIPELTPGSTEDLSNTVTYTNLFDAAGLVVTKALQGAGAPQFGQDKTFSVTVTCVYADETILETTLQLSAENGWTATITDVVAGAACTIVEDDLQGADAVVITPNAGEDTTTGSIQIPETGVAAVEVTNWYLTGSLEVTKTFAGAGAEKFGTDDFVLALSCIRDDVDVEIPGGTVRTVSADAPTALYENLPTGAECTLTETSTGGANSTAVLDADGELLVADATEGYTFTVVTDPTILSVDDQAQDALQVQNTFNVAQVSLTKTVETAAVNAEGMPVSYGPFEVELSCTWNGGSVTAAEDMVRTIADGETVTWTELPQGAACAVTETDDAGASSTSIVVTEADTTGETIVGALAQLAPLPAEGESGQTSVAITNVFDVTTLTIAKVVDGNAAGSVTRTFPVAVTCVLVDASHPAPGLVVHDAFHQIGGPSHLTAAIDNLPVGATCDVTETERGGAARTTVSVNGATIEAGTVTVALTEATALVFTNTFIAPLPNTGGIFAWGIALLGILTVLLGALLLMARRRRRDA